MIENKKIQIDFDDLIKKAIKNIKKYEYKSAYQFIMDANYADPNRPESQNLLGIWYELQGDDNLARKHYRMAYVLDPIYKPACVNLERVSTLFPTRHIPIDYGEILTEDNIQTEQKTITNVKN